MDSDADSPNADSVGQHGVGHHGVGHHGVGQHGLGPHVVGQRVVVRRLLPGQRGPSGGPAMTDVLGICESWGNGTCVVQTSEGERVQIAIATIVSGKPVPPRPSVRHRVRAREAEGHGLTIWPNLDRVDLGEWVLRAHPGDPGDRPRKRANSALAMGDSGIPLMHATNTVRNFYLDHGQAPMVQVEQGSSYDRWFAGLDWEIVEGGSTHFQVASTAQALRTANRIAIPSSVQPILIDDDGPRASAYVDSKEHPTAIARGVLDGDWFGVFGLHVAPEVRRRGIALQLMAELFGWAAAHGATTLWLHVEEDNQAALDLYERLGFLTHHSLHYRQAPA